MHKVKKKETLYSICRDYDITLEELKKANPEMTSPDYVLKKGTIIFIRFAAAPSDTPVVNLNQIPVFRLQCSGQRMFAAVSGTVNFSVKGRGIESSHLNIAAVKRRFSYKNDHFVMPGSARRAARTRRLPYAPTAPGQSNNARECTCPPGRRTVAGFLFAICQPAKITGACAPPGRGGREGGDPSR